MGNVRHGGNRAPVLSGWVAVERSWVRTRLVVGLAGLVLAAVVGFVGAGVARASAPPPNDTLAGATVISSLPFSTTEDTTAATTDATDVEVAAVCDASAPNPPHSVWFDYTPASDQVITVDTSGSNYETGIGVVIGAPGSFQRVACSLTQSSFAVTAGQTYHMDVVDFGSGTGGTLQLSVQQVAGITGKVTNAATHTAISDVGVSVFDASSGNQVGFASTDANGDYIVTGLAAGTYKVGFNGNGYVQQYYKAKRSLATANTVTVTTGATVAGINAAMGGSPTSGQISGVVTSAVTHSAIAGAGVTVYDAFSGFPLAFADTDASGGYTVAGLNPGTYKVGFSSGSSGGGYAPQFFRDKPSLATAKALTVTAGGITSGISAALRPGAQITGKVKDAITNAAIAGASVTVYDAASGDFVGFATTDSGGRYAVSSLAAGAYKVGFGAFSGNAYAPQFYKDEPSLATADPVAVNHGETVTGINAAMQPNGQITGTVTDASTHAPLSGIDVPIYDASSGSLVAGAFTDANGQYAVSGLTPGSYKVGFSTDLGFGGNYVPQFYNDEPSLATADPVAVSAGATVAGIDAAMQPGGQITGTVTDASTHTGIPGAIVSVFDASSGNQVGFVSTDSTGTYTVSLLAPGAYKVGFAANGFVPQFYKSKRSLAAANPITVDGGATVPGIDATMRAGAQLGKRPGLPANRRRSSTGPGRLLQPQRATLSTLRRIKPQRLALYQHLSFAARRSVHLGGTRRNLP